MLCSFVETRTTRRMARLLVPICTAVLRNPTLISTTRHFSNNNKQQQHSLQSVSHGKNFFFNVPLSSETINEKKGMVLLPKARQETKETCLIDQCHNDIAIGIVKEGEGK